MLKLPAPPFPTRFNSDEIKAPIPAAGLSHANQDWPTETEMNCGAAEANPASLKDSNHVEWRLQTDREQHIKRLETKIEQIGSHETIAGKSNSCDKPSSKSLVDSGYAPSESAKSPNNGYVHRINSQDFVETMAEFAQGAETAPEETAREGEALLADAQPYGKLDEPISPSIEREDDVTESNSSSPGKNFVLVPPTPIKKGEEINLAESEEDEGDAINVAARRRVPTTLPSAADARRISFSHSVRISGGIKTRPKEIPKTILNDLFSPKYNSSETGNPAMTSSPASPVLHDLFPRRLPRNASLTRSRPSSPSRRDTSSSHAIAYSTAGSSAQSRSSSPCSSIYAPLQPPSQIAPSPQFIYKQSNLKRKAQKRENRTTGTISFQQYLQARTATADETEEQVVKAYRDLVAEQEERRKKIRWQNFQAKQRKRANQQNQKTNESDDSGKGFWSRVSEMLVAAGGAGRVRGSIPTANFVSTGTNYGTLHAHSAEPHLIAQRNAIRRAASSLSISTADFSEDTESDSDNSEEIFLRQQFRKEVTKTEIQVRFGAAPKRWLTKDWWAYKLGQGWLTVRSACACFGPAAESREAENLGEYEQV